MKTSSNFLSRMAVPTVMVNMEVELLLFIHSFLISFHDVQSFLRSPCLHFVFFFSVVLASRTGNTTWSVTRHKECAI
jgi:hypothetical protein